MRQKTKYYPMHILIYGVIVATSSIITLLAASYMGWLTLSFTITTISRIVFALIFTVVASIVLRQNEKENLMSSNTQPPQIMSTENTKTNFCSNCSTPTIPEATFCTHCGKQI